ncbi:MAG: TIGR02281 family clan AA aspartic protease [Rhodobacteraceae bacterium]|nr:TIGR02281 family clan AA aspartic protease [Paracoccaceae bacterium]
MDADQTARMLYLVLLGAAVAGALILQSRGRRGAAAQQLAVWGLIFIGVIAGAGLWSDIAKTMPQEATVGPGGAISVPRGPDGHYHVTLRIGGVPVRFMIDTGASDMVLTPADARRVGIDPAHLAFVGSANTANGEVATARVKLHDVTLGPVTDRVVSAEVNKVAMDSSLLGMSYLQRFGKIEIAGDRMVLTR